MVYTTRIRLNIVQDCQHRSVGIVYFQQDVWRVCLSQASITHVYSDVAKLYLGNQIAFWSI